MRTHRLKGLSICTVLRPTWARGGSIYDSRCSVLSTYTCAVEAQIQGSYKIYARRPHMRAEIDILEP